MPSNLPFVKQLINSGDELLILVGAGISKNSPSNLPTGIDFINSFYNFLRLKDADSEFESNIHVFKNHSSLRFENIMSLIERHFLARTHPLLECYKKSTIYNDCHLQLAALGKQGHKIATTNFDTLIERAYLEIGLRPSPIITDEDFQKHHFIGNIYKLHGSLERYDNKDKVWLDFSNSLRLTLEQVGMQGYKFATSFPKRQFLINSFKNTDLVLVGYSGSDDFDICPLLLNTQSNKKIIWLDYNPETKTLYSGKEIIENPGRFGKIGKIINELIRNGLRQKDRCFVVQSDSLSLLSSIRSALNNNDKLPSSSKTENDFDSTTYFYNKLEQILPNLDSIQRMKAVLYSQTENFTASLRQYEKILDTIDGQSDQYLKSKVLYEIALCYFNQIHPDYESAIRFAEKSYEIDLKNGFGCMFLSADLLGRLYRATGKLKLSQQMYQTALSIPMDLDDYFNKYQYAVLLNNYSNLLYHIGKWKESINVAKKSSSLYKKIGDFSGTIKIARALSVTLMESGYVDESISELENVEQLTHELGSLEDLCFLYNEFGVAFKLKLDYESAIKFHYRSLEYARLLGKEEEIARQYYNIAVCRGRQGDYKAAEDLNNKSLEIRGRLQESFEKSRSLSENLQLTGGILTGLGCYSEARIAFQRSNEFAEPIQYAQVICDNYVNLLTIAMMLKEDKNVRMIAAKLKNLLLVQYQMIARWTMIQKIIDEYWLLSKNY